jgi:PAS domain S-box-containing protein
MSDSQFKLREGAAALGLAHAFTRDLSGKILTWSAGAEQLYQWRADEALGKVSHELLKTKFPKPLSEIEADVLRTSSWQGELVHRCKDDSEIVVASHWALVTDPDGSPRAMLEVNNDITETKRLSRELETALRSAEAARAEAQNANLAKDEFLNHISHEIRNPLNIVTLSLQVLRRRLAGSGDDVEHTLSRMQTSGDRLGLLIDELLDATKFVSGRLELAKRPVQIDHLVIEAVDSIKPIAQSQNISVSVASDKDPGVVEADPRRLHQILSNLLSNSLKFTPKGGTICVTIIPSPEEVELRVWDNGQGILVDDIPHVFDRFWQAQTHTVRTGLGLGLYITRSLVEAHGGEVSAFSEGHGRGATFTVILPRHWAGVGRTHEGR